MGELGPSCGAWSAPVPRDLKLSNWGPRKASVETDPRNQSAPQHCNSKLWLPQPPLLLRRLRPHPPSRPPCLLPPCLLPESCLTWLAPRAGGRAQCLEPIENKATFGASQGGGEGLAGRGLDWGPGGGGKAPVWPGTPHPAPIEIYCSEEGLISAGALRVQGPGEEAGNP